VFDSSIVAILKAPSFPKLFSFFCFDNVNPKFIFILFEIYLVNSTFVRLNDSQLLYKDFVHHLLSVYFLNKVFDFSFSIFFLFFLLKKNLLIQGPEEKIIGQVFQIKVKYFQIQLYFLLF